MRPRVVRGSGLGALCLLLACSGAERLPADPPEAHAAAVPAPAADEPATERRPPAPPRRIDPLVDAPEGFWLVSRPDGHATCWPMHAEPTSDGREGWLRPNARFDLFEALIGHRYVHGAAPFPFADGVLSFHYRLDDDQISIEQPSTWRVLDECRHTMEAAAFPWFASAQACAEALGERAPMEFGACAELVASYPRAHPRQTRFERIVARGGTMWERRAEGCIAWRFDPRRRIGGEPVVSTTRYDPATGQRVHRETYGYEFSRGRLTRTGPTITEYTDGERSRRIKVRCGMIDRVHHDEGPMAQLGELRWYYEREDCEASPPAWSQIDRC